MLVNDRFKNCITDVKTIRGANCDSDHYLVRMKIKVKLKRRITTKLIIVDRYDTTKFKDVEHYKCFKSEIYKHSRNMNTHSTGSINTMWKKIRDTIK